MMSRKKQPTFIPSSAGPIFPVIVVLFLIFSCIRLTQPGLSHGDEFSDAGVMNAGENFARLGFGPSHGLPVFWPLATKIPPTNRPDSPEFSELDVWGTYARLPALYAWVNGTLQHLFGNGSILPYRFVSMAFSAAALAAFYYFILWATQSTRLAGMSTLLYLCNPFFIANFDSLHQHAIMDTWRNLALAGLAWLLTRKLTPSLWAGLWLALFLLSLTAYEYLPWLTGFIILAAVYRASKTGWRDGLAILCLGSAFAAGLALHFGLVAWHYGSIQEALNDRLSNAAQRMGGSEVLAGGAGALSWQAWWNLVALRFPLQVAVFPWFWLGLLACAAAIAWHFLKPAHKTGIPGTLLLAALLFAGGFSWYVLMPAHCVDHAGLSFLQKFLIPGVVLALAIPFELLARLAEQCLPGRSLPRTLAIWTLPTALAVTGVLSSELPVTPKLRAFEQEFDKVAASLRQLQRRVPPDQFAACNVFRPTWMMSYYLGARVRTVETAAEFDSLPAKPSMFLLVPVNNPATQELLQRLQSGYTQTGIADNRRLPFYIFQKNPDAPPALTAPDRPPHS